MPRCFVPVGRHRRSKVEIAKTVRAGKNMALGNTTFALPMASKSSVKNFRLTVSGSPQSAFAQYCSAGTPR
jgi:hypothetical protein